MTELTRLIPEEAKISPIARIFPEMTETEYQELVRDIDAHGLEEAVWVNEDREVIDGRHRVRACAELGKSVEFRVFHGDEEGQKRFVLSLNLMRRHLSDSQRAMVAQKFANLGRGDNQHTGEDGSIAPCSQTAAAKQLKVSRESVKRAEKVYKRGVPEIQKAVECGEVSVSAAAEVVELSADEQLCLFEEGTDKVKAKAAELRATKKKPSKDRVLAGSQPPEAHYPEIVRTEVIVVGPLIQGAPAFPNSDSVPITFGAFEDLPVPAAAGEDCALYLHGDAHQLQLAIQWAAEWGFTPNTVLTITWEEPVADQPLHLLTAHYVLALRGKPDLSDVETSTLLHVGAHRPSGVADRLLELVEAVTPGKKLLINGNTDRPGWTLWAKLLENDTNNKNEFTAEGDE